MEKNSNTPLYLRKGIYDVLGTSLGLKVVATLLLDIKRVIVVKR
jgi:hypothetical protein